MNNNTNIRRAARAGAASGAGRTWLAGVATVALACAAHAAGPVASAPADKHVAVTLESIPDSKVKRVVLSAKAAERLGIETGKVGEETVVLKQMVSGLVTAPFDQPQPKPGAACSAVSRKLKRVRRRMGLRVPVTAPAASRRLPPSPARHRSDRRILAAAFRQSARPWPHRPPSRNQPWSRHRFRRTRLLPARLGCS